jgi:hypothetical protein
MMHGLKGSKKAAGSGTIGHLLILKTREIHLMRRIPSES